MLVIGISIRFIGIELGQPTEHKGSSYRERIEYRGFRKFHSAEFRKLYKLNLTPLTIVIDNQGKVEKIWAGAFNENSKADMETYFGISRDGVR